jgi:hypothetical protein
VFNVARHARATCGVPHRQSQQTGAPRWPAPPAKDAPPAAPVHQTAAGGLALREAIAEEARWRDPDDLDAHTRAPKVATAFRRVGQLARLLDPARGNELAFWYA